MDSDKPIELPIGKKIKKIEDTTKYFQPRDPRFDPKCSGSDDRRHFERNYAFVNDLRKKELLELKKAFKNELDPSKKSEIQAAIDRISHAIDVKIKPKKREKSKKIELVEQYKNLKKSGKLSKYLERKRKKLIKKDQQ